MSIASRPQRTIAREARVQGVSFLAGRDVQLRFLPAEAGAGVVFRRLDLPDQPTVPALVKYVIPRQRRTTIEHGPAVVEMVEHVMAALAGLRIDNCMVEIDGPETPGCDGSSRAFADAISGAGFLEQDASRETLVIDRPITVREGDSILTAFPGDPGHLVLAYQLDYGPRTSIGRQSFFVDVNPESFRDELAASRTFLLQAEADALRKGRDRVEDDRTRPADLRPGRALSATSFGSPTSAPDTRPSTCSVTSPWSARTCLGTSLLIGRATSSMPSWPGGFSSRPSGTIRTRTPPDSRSWRSARSSRRLPTAIRSSWSTAWSPWSRVVGSWP